jgi:hypothetical protein
MSTPRLTAAGIALAFALSSASTAAMADSVDYGRTSAPTKITTESATPQAPKPDTNAANDRLPSPGEVGSDIGEGAATAAKTVGQTTKEVTTTIGHGARDTTKAIGHGTRDFFHSIGEGFRKAW